MIKKGKQVQIICGKDKGKKGEVIEINRSENKSKIKGINIIKKHESLIDLWVSEPDKGIYFAMNNLISVFE